MKKLSQYVNQYSYHIEYDKEDHIFIGRCGELPSLAAHGDTHEQALKEIKNAVLGSLKWMQEENKAIPQPMSLHKYSGQFRIRMLPEKHREIAIKASLQGVSMNQFIINKLA